MTYEQFIEECRNKPEPTERYQRHHIVPRSEGGLNRPNNMIKLSYEDHWMAHQLLAEKYPNNEGLQRIAKKSLEAFIKTCESQATNTDGKKGCKGLERWEEWRRNLSINHISPHDDGSLSYEEKVARYERIKKEKADIIERKNLRKEYAEFKKEYCDKSVMLRNAMHEIKDIYKQLQKEKKELDVIKHLNFNEWVDEFRPEHKNIKLEKKC